MSNEDKKKVGLNDVNFLGLGENTKGEQEEVIVDEEETQEQLEEETPKTGQEDTEQELDTDDGDPPAKTDEDDQETPSEDEGKDEEDESSEKEAQDEEEDEQEPSIFAVTAEDMGMSLDDFEENELEEVNLEDPTTEDLSKFIKIISDKRASERYNKTIEKYPEVEGMLEFAENGGDPRQYIETMYPQFDYSKIDFDEQVADDEQAQEQIVRNELLAQDTPEEEVDEMIEDFRNGGILQKQAKRSLKKLQNMQQRQQDQLIEQQKEVAQKRRKQAEQEKEEFESIIEESDSIKGLKMPDTDKDDLKKYLFEPVNDQGQSQAFVDGNQMTKEERIALAYLKMKGFDFETLIENEAESKNAKRVKEQIKKTKKKVSSKKDKEKKTSGKVQDIKPLI